MSTRPNTNKIRKLLNDIYHDDYDRLIQDCYDRPELRKLRLYSQLKANTPGEQLIDFLLKRAGYEIMLNLARSRDPIQYAKGKPYTIEDDGQSEPDNEFDHPPAIERLGSIRGLWPGILFITVVVGAAILLFTPLIWNKPKIVSFDPPKDTIVRANNRVSIRANIKNSHNFTEVQWEAEEGRIIGNGRMMVTYQAPSSNGTDKISLVLKWWGIRLDDDSVILRIEDNIPTAATTLTPTPTAYPSPSPTSSETFTPTATATSTATHTPASTPSPTGTPTPTVPIETPSVTPTGTPTITPQPSVIATTSILPSGTFTLLNPTILQEPTYGPTVFVWEWTGTLRPDIGFEVRAWRDGELPAGVHDAVLDNREGRIERTGPNKYRLQTDISEAAGVRGVGGEYWWTVVLIKINPEYVDLGQQAEPGRLRFVMRTKSESDGNGPIWE